MPVSASIIVPLACGPAQALACLEAIAAQPAAPEYEVIVIDDGSGELGELMGRLEGDVQVLRHDRPQGLGACARLGAERASADVVVLLRGAAVPAPGWLSPLLQALEDPSLGAVVASATSCALPTPLAAWAVAARRSEVDWEALDGVPDELVVATIALQLSARGLSLATSAASVAEPAARLSPMRRAAGEPPELTIVIPTLDATSDRVRACVAAVQRTAEVAHEIVIVDNGAPPQGFSAPVNAGLRAARTAYAVVMNDDVLPLEGWWPPLREALDEGAAVAFPLTVEGPMREDFAAWCFALTRETIEDFGHADGEFFDPALVLWFQDTDLLLALRSAGRPPRLVAESRIRHGLSQSVASPDPELSRWVQAQVELDRERFQAKHPDVPLVRRQLAA